MGILACGGGDGGESGGTAEESGSAVTTPIDNAKAAAADLEAAASETHTVKLAVDGMT